MFYFLFYFHFGMETNLADLLVEDCDHIPRLLAPSVERLIHKHALLIRAVVINYEWKIYRDVRYFDALSKSKKNHCSCQKYTDEKNLMIIFFQI